MRSEEYFGGIDWSLTQAYNVGLNSMYLNVRGREGEGVISQSSVQPLADEIAAKLETIVDPETGKKVFSKAYVSNDEYKREHPDKAPDIVLGFNRGYRISDESALGEFPERHLKQRDDPWAADHCIDPATVPGTLMINREIGGKAPKLYDLAPTIMKIFGLEPDKRMTGKPLIK
jgi:predicted AlkP superfamily phosphohydrolase/phosphomutase